MNRRELLLIVIVIFCYSCYAIVFPVIALNISHHVERLSQPALDSGRFIIPQNYYIPNGSNTLNSTHDLSEFQHLLRKIQYPHPYEEHVFDCSESAAFTEWYLENHGYDTAIVVGTNAQGEVHAWVEVRGVIPLYEDFPVTMCIERFQDSPYFSPLVKKEYIHDQEYYEDVFEACEAWGGCLEWDWWNAANIAGDASINSI